MDEDNQKISLNISIFFHYTYLSSYLYTFKNQSTFSIPIDKVFYFFGNFDEKEGREKERESISKIGKSRPRGFAQIYDLQDFVALL